MEQPTSKNFNLAAIGAFAGFVAVALGAFGTHTLRARITAQDLATFQTGVQYHLIHAVMAVVAATLGRKNAATLFLVGIVFFSLPLYVLAVGGPKWMGAVAPIGGLSFMAGWIFLGISFLREKR
ncbi:MAG: DUF423 domain-containing protein [Armatimonadetes bacterium]|nr:DUF423 domain-containing protein [Armatimonadota bacterium]